MTFDEWMLTVAPTHKPSDDSVTLRVLRRCWDDSRTVERQRCASLCRRVADETRNTEVARIAGQMLANWISTGTPMADSEMARRDALTDCREADRVWTNDVLRLIQRHAPHIPMSEHGDESRATFLAFARSVAALGRA